MTEPNQRWISFVNASGETIPPYAILWVKPLTDAWDDIDNDDRVESSIKWKVYKPVFPTVAEVMTDPGGIDYPILLALNSSAEVPIDATGRMTFATDGPAWMAVYGPGDLTDVAYQRYPEGSPIGPASDEWKGCLGGIGFRTVRLMDLTTGRRRVLVMADPGPYELRLVSPGVYGSPGGTPIFDEANATVIDSATQGPFEIGACVPCRFVTSVFVQETDVTEPVYPVHFDRQSMLYVANESDSTCSHNCIPPKPMVLAQPVGMIGTWARTNGRLVAGMGQGQNIFIDVPVLSVTTPGTADVQLGCHAQLSGTVLGEFANPLEAVELEEGDLVDVVWNGCKALIVSVDGTCEEEV